MKQQNYSNHSRYVPAFHFFTGTLVILVLIYRLFEIGKVLMLPHHSLAHFLYYFAVPLSVSVILLMLFWYSRQFALRAQDRAIRAEESLRYYILTGKAIDRRITMRQIIALRFAGDDELVSLTQQAAEKNMSGDEIKKAIKNWRPDNHRA